MTSIIDYIPYTDEMTPIYFVEWGIRNTEIRHYSTWLAGAETRETKHISLYPTFLPQHVAPSIIPHEIILDHDKYLTTLQYPDTLTYPQDTKPGVQVININQNLFGYSPKIATLISNLVLHV
ncbi:Hypothetical protein HVR_LOCUS671 [uncultured virus]|nr:Hypothetical protein HVR_LOCUS671 [uncultured virus]